VLVRNKVHVALFALVAVWAWARMTGLEIVSLDLAVVPLLVLATYQWNRLTDRVEDAINCPEDLAGAVRDARMITAICVLSVATGLGLALMKGSRGAVGLAAGCVVLGLAYSSPLRIGRRSLRLKSHFLVKNASGAVGWTILTVLYPALHAGASVSAPLVLATAVMFLGVWAVELVWDLRDVAGDREAHVNSLPVLHGTSSARRLGYALCLVMALVAGLSVAFHLVPALWLAGLVNSAVISYWIWRFDVTAPRLWSHVLVLIETVLLVGLGILA
jgi:4-hydroxybenzoate polyprenyltransferase